MPTKQESPPGTDLPVRLPRMPSYSAPPSLCSLPPSGSLSHNPSTPKEWNRPAFPLLFRLG